VIEQTHKKIEMWQRDGCREEFRSVVLNAIKEVAGPSFFSLMVIAVAFLPVLVLEGQEGRLFRPLALTKTFCMVVAAVLAITLDPALRLLITRVGRFTFRPAWLRRPLNALLVGRIHPEERHPVSRLLIRFYQPFVRFTLQWRWAVIAGALVLMLLTIPAWLRLGSEFMPLLDEGTLLFMPTTLPGISLTEARRLLQAQDRVLAAFPEVARVSGKAGRAETATDPAPPSMIEAVIQLKPVEQWPTVPVWYSNGPDWLKPALRHFTSDRSSTQDVVARMDRALHTPGVSNAWTMPIRGRIEMQATGIRTAVGVKVTGADPEVIQQIGRKVEEALYRVPGTRTAFSERSGEGNFLDLNLDRDRLGRYGLNIDDAGSVISGAVGGDNVTTVLDGSARYPVSVRYLADFRNSVETLEQIRVPAANGRREIPLAQLATIGMTSGPSMLRDDNGMITGYVYADVAGRDIGGYLEEARRAVQRDVKLPAGYAVAWSGQYEAMERVRERLKLALPATAFLIVLLLYWNTRSLAKTALVLLAAPFSAVGAVWLMYALGYHLSIAAWVGLIALLGVDAETGVFMLLYLDLALEERRKAGFLRTRADLRLAILEGAARRIRPKFMTVSAMFIGLAPILWSTGAGADVMKRIAAPMIGGIFTSFLLELAVYPALYELWKWRSEVRHNTSAVLAPVLNLASS
jgi:Cu(I)/Ag(I) efflux system membrane protein CusA/SilA